MYAINKKLLTELRKKTGYSFAKCNEAMKLHENDTSKAEDWLHRQAEKDGWLKAKKLQNRSTGEGLVGVLADRNHVALVEVYCVVLLNFLFRFFWKKNILIQIFKLIISPYCFCLDRQQSVIDVVLLFFLPSILKNVFPPTSTLFNSENVF